MFYSAHEVLESEELTAAFEVGILTLPKDEAEEVDRLLAARRRPTPAQAFRRMIERWRR